MIVQMVPQTCPVYMVPKSDLLLAPKSLQQGAWWEENKMEKWVKDALEEALLKACLVKEAVVTEDYGDNKCRVKVDLHRLSNVLSKEWLVKKAEVMILEDSGDVTCWMDVELDGRNIEKVEQKSAEAKERKEREKKWLIE